MKNGVALTLGLVGGMALATTVRSRLGSPAVVNPARVRDLAGRLGEWTRGVIEAAGDDPDEVEFDPNEYPVHARDLEDALDAPVLGFGYSRVAVRIAPGLVAKLPWRYDGQLRSESEYDAWSEATDEVRAMMLPPVDFVSPGIIVFPEVAPVARDSREEMRLSDAAKAELEEAQARWMALSRAGVPGALTRDVYGAQNWGRFDGRLVLLDYEDEGSFNKRTASPQKKRSREALARSAAGRTPFSEWLRAVARAAGYRTPAAMGRAHPRVPFHDRWYEGASVALVVGEVRGLRGGVE